VCKYTRLLHYVITICGLVLLLGGTLAESLQLESGVLEGLGYIFFYLFAFALLGIAPTSLVAFFVCRKYKRLVLQGALLWVFIGTLWADNETDLTVTIFFLIYALTVLFFFFKVAHKNKPAG
jgi:hypothetical protein